MFGGKCRNRTAIPTPKVGVLPLHYILHIGASSRNRTHAKCLQDTCSTVKLWKHLGRAIVDSSIPMGCQGFHADRGEPYNSCQQLAVVGGFEPPIDRVKVCCLTTWRYHNIVGAED